MDETRPNNNAKKGFGSMSVEQRRAIASKGGKSAQRQGTAYHWTSEQAQRAGRIGGLKSRRNIGRKTL